jgi:hypothetical protein
METNREAIIKAAVNEFIVNPYLSMTVVMNKYGLTAAEIFDEVAPAYVHALAAR